MNVIKNANKDKQRKKKLKDYKRKHVNSTSESDISEMSEISSLDDGMIQVSDSSNANPAIIDKDKLHVINSKVQSMNTKSSQNPESHSFYSEIDFSREKLWNKSIKENRDKYMLNVVDEKGEEHDTERAFQNNDNSHIRTIIKREYKPFDQLLEMELKKAENDGKVVNEKVEDFAHGLDTNERLEIISNAEAIDRTRLGIVKPRNSLPPKVEPKMSYENALPSCATPANKSNSLRLKEEKKFEEHK